MCLVFIATIVGSFCAEIVNNEEKILQPIKETQPRKRDIGISGSGGLHGFSGVHGFGSLNGLSALSDCDTPSLGLHAHSSYASGYSSSYAPGYSSSYAPGYSSSYGYGQGYLSSGIGKLM